MPATMVKRAVAPAASAVGGASTVPAVYALSSVAAPAGRTCGSAALPTQRMRAPLPVLCAARRCCNKRW